MKSFIFVVGFLLVAGCASTPQKPATTPEAQEIDKETASKMVQGYLMQRTDCAGFTAPADGGTVWIFRVSTGDLASYFAPDTPVLLVDKHSGYISWRAPSKE